MIEAALNTVLDSALWQLASHLSLLSMVAIGSGLGAVLPEIHRFVVEQHHWVTNEQFVAFYTIGQAAPGPNFMYVTLLGAQVAGWVGAAVLSVAVIAPCCLFTYMLARLGMVGGEGRVQRILRSGLAPVSVALMLSSSWVLANTVDQDWRAALITLLSAVVLFTTRVHPLWLIAAGAMAGIAGLV
jgi:chromate transporter